MVIVTFIQEDSLNFSQRQPPNIPEGIVPFIGV